MGIGELPATIADRSIPIRLERRARSEPVTRFRIREAEAEAVPIREALEAYLATLVDRLAHARPDIPHQLGDRSADAWEPLLAIADAAGGDWPARARAAAIALSGERMDDLDEAPAEHPPAGRHPGHLRPRGDRQAPDGASSSRTSPAMTSDPGATGATASPSAPTAWAGCSAATTSSPTCCDSAAARRHTARGYHRADFESVWERYLPASRRTLRASHRHTTRHPSTSLHAQEAPLVTV